MATPHGKESTNIPPTALGLCCFTSTEKNLQKPMGAEHRPAGAAGKPTGKPSLPSLALLGEKTARTVS